jgi:hypothetical protein
MQTLDHITRNPEVMAGNLDFPYGALLFLILSGSVPPVMR